MKMLTIFISAVKLTFDSDVALNKSTASYMSL